MFNGSITKRAECDEKAVQAMRPHLVARQAHQPAAAARVERSDKWWEGSDSEGGEGVLDEDEITMGLSGRQSGVERC
jgi:hypothetical protein